MLVEGKDVGLATYHSNGIYSVHWYYQEARGRQAIDLGKAMIGLLFDKYDAKILRALIRTDLKASRWACRQLGFKSYGVLTFADNEDNEILLMTKDEYTAMKDALNG